MSVSYPHPTTVITDPLPLPAEEIAARWVERRCRVSTTQAALIRDLQGLGDRREATR